MFKKEESYGEFRVFIVIAMIIGLLIAGAIEACRKTPRLSNIQVTEYYTKIDEVRKRKTEGWTNITEWLYDKHRQEAIEEVNAIYSSEKDWKMYGAIVGLGVFLILFPSIFDFSGLLLRRITR